MNLWQAAKCGYPVCTDFSTTQKGICKRQLCADSVTTFTAENKVSKTRCGATGTSLSLIPFRVSLYRLVNELSKLTSTSKLSAHVLHRNWSRAVCFIRSLRPVLRLTRAPGYMRWSISIKPFTLLLTAYSLKNPWRAMFAVAMLRDLGN